MNEKEAIHCIICYTWQINRGQLHKSLFYQVLLLFVHGHAS